MMNLLISLLKSNILLKITSKKNCDDHDDDNIIETKLVTEATNVLKYDENKNTSKNCIVVRLLF